MAFPLFFLLAAALGGAEAISGSRRKRTMLESEAERIDTINIHRT